MTSNQSQSQSRGQAVLVMQRCDYLAACSEEPDRLTRRYGTPALRAAQKCVATWMREAGLIVHRDAVGNLIGRLEGTEPNAPALLLGSHLDSVRDAGKYDGPLGVLVALATVERLQSRGERLPFPLELIAFADEEGLRFQTSYLGSRALAGTLDAAALSLTDADGTTLADAIRAFDGTPDALPLARRDRRGLLGYIEVHIEQGPQLETLGQPVGIVTAIAGQTRIAVELTGRAGHAGTVPMALRHDALAAAAELILTVEATARAQPGLVATVGQLAVEPGASNVIPGCARLSVDVRHPDDQTRDAPCTVLHEQARQIAVTRGIDLEWTIVQDDPAVSCDAGLADTLARAATDLGYSAPRLSSGAGHDAVALAELTRVAMLFVRCAGGVSHHPAEAVTTGDVAVAISILDRCVALLTQAGAIRR